jgi:hypothetical protein
MKVVQIYTITRDEVENLDLSRFFDNHGTWPMQRGLSLERLMDSLILEVDGYGEDPREICTIPEVRAYFQRLYELWPWWAFFLHTGAQNLAVSYLCLLDDVRVVPSATPGKTGFRCNAEQLQVLLMHEFACLNFLCDRAGLSEERSDIRSRAVVDMFNCTSGKEMNP